VNDPLTSVSTYFTKFDEVLQVPPTLTPDPHFSTPASNWSSVPELDETTDAHETQEDESGETAETFMYARLPSRVAPPQQLPY
jgi:hypothetical protein